MSVMAAPRASLAHATSTRCDKEDERPSGVMLRKPRVLIAEDDTSFTALLERFLSRAGYIVHFAPDGHEALRVMDEVEPQIILADICMPHLDGLGFARAARGRDPDVQLVLMTADPDIRSATTAIELGACRYLSKPFTRAELLLAVEHAEGECERAEERRSALSLLRSFEDEQRRTTELERAFRDVLGSLWMAYQPIVRASDGSVFAYEALLRSSDKRLPSPPEVLRAAEQLEAIDDLGRVVRERASAPFGGPEAAPVLFVNLHPRDVLDEELFAPGAPLSRIAHRVVLELTERASLDDIPDLLERASRLRAMGFRLAIDDLGAGYAAVSSIALLEPELVKLDMSLVRGVHENRTKTQIVRHLVRMAHDSGALVVAEGVETESERARLVELGCDFLQGYLIGRPGKLPA